MRSELGLQLLVAPSAMPCPHTLQAPEQAYSSSCLPNPLCFTSLAHTHEHMHTHAGAATGGGQPLPAQLSLLHLTHHTYMHTQPHTHTQPQPHMHTRAFRRCGRRRWPAWMTRVQAMMGGQRGRGSRLRGTRGKQQQLLLLPAGQAGEVHRKVPGGGHKQGGPRRAGVGVGARVGRGPPIGAAAGGASRVRHSCCTTSCMLHARCPHEGLAEGE